MLLKEDYQIYPAGYPGRLSEEETVYIVQDLLNKGPNEAVAFLIACKEPFLRESLTTHYIKEWIALINQFSERETYSVDGMILEKWNPEHRDRLINRIIPQVRNQ